jgi:uncharacterized protein (TIGR02118 family)
MAMAQLVVMYKAPKDSAAFDKHYFEKHVPIAKRTPRLNKVRSQQTAGGHSLRAIAVSSDRYAPLR